MVTIAERTYEAQKAAERAEVRYFEYDGDGIDAARVEAELKAAMETARAEAETLQQEAGGVVFSVFADFREELEERIEKKVARRARKLGVEVPALTWHETFMETKRVKDADGRWVDEVFERQFVAVKGAAPRLAGYEFLASLQHEEAGTMVRKVPGTDDVDTAAYRDADAACAHCKLDRRRKASYLVRHEGTGEIVQVGSTCVRDFLGGTDPKSVVKAFEWFDLLYEMLDDASERDGGSFGVARVQTPVDEFMEHVACMMREHGWRSKAEARDQGGLATSELAASNRAYMLKRKTDRQGAPMWIAPEAQDAERGAAAVAWVREEIGAKVHGDRQAEGASDYEHNLYVALAGDFLPDRAEGIAASAIRAYERTMEREAERKREAEKSASSEHVAAVGDRLELTLECEAVFESDGYYGVTYITKLSDEAGNVFKWFGSWRMEVGASYVGRWTVKEHDEYRGVKETVLTRPAKVEVLEAA